MKRIKWLLLVAGWALAVSGGTAEITISCGPVGLQQTLCRQATSEWAQQTGNRVRVVKPPERTNDQYLQYLLALGEGDPAVDVYQIDVIWPGLLSRYLVDLHQYISATELSRHFPEIVENNTVGGRLVGVPWYTDVGLLFYRKDLLEKYGLPVPGTWSELAETALSAQEGERQAGNASIWGYVFQGGRYEGLTCNALEWVESHGGGGFVDADGNITANNPRAALALARVAGWIDIITPRRVTSFNEEDARRMFQSGNAVFMRNWPYAWAMANGADSPVAGKVGIAPLPRGGRSGRSAGTLGGWQLAVSRFSKAPETAADLVRYLTSELVQKQRAVAGAYLPTLPGLYEDPDVLAANPFFSDLRNVLGNTVTRPSASTGQEYMAVSTRIWEAAWDTLQAKQSATESLAELESQLKLLRTRSKKWRTEAGVVQIEK